MRPSHPPPELSGRREALTSLDLGSRPINWAAFIYGISHRRFDRGITGDVGKKRWLAPSVAAILLIVAAVNATVLAANYDTSFTVTAPPDGRVIAAALWTV